MFGHGSLDISRSFRTMGGIGNIIGYKAETKTFATDDLSIDERYEAKKTTEDVASYNSAVALAASSQADATYGKWVAVSYSDTLKSVINKYDDGLPQPFKNIIQGGSDNSFTSHGSLRLDDSDSYGTSGSFHAKLAKNWMVKINLWSDNFEYFEDNLKDNKIDRFDDDSFSGNGDGYTDWINFWLIEENDYFSLDIDNERSDTAQLKVVIEGVTYTSSNPPNSDNEAKVWLKEVWHWNPTFGTIAYTPEQDNTNTNTNTNEDEELECKDSDCKADEKAVKKTGWNGVETCECSSDFGQDDTEMTKTKLAMIAGGVALAGIVVYSMTQQS